MPSPTWSQLLADWPWFRGEGNYPIAAYSEYLPPPRLGRKAYSPVPLPFFDNPESDTWPVTEYEEVFELQAGFSTLARELIAALAALGGGRHAHGLSKAKLAGNPFWPSELAASAGKLNHERYVVLTPLSLSRTQDDKGRIRWTLFGASEQGPARGFWQGFYSAPGWELPEEDSLHFIRRLLASAFDEPEESLVDLRKAGFRIHPDGDAPLVPHWKEGPLPQWTKPYLWSAGQHIQGLRFLLTFRPFGQLPESVRKAYLAGNIHLLPFPGSLVFWGCNEYLRLQHELPFAIQIPLLQAMGRHEGPFGIRVPQAGWIDDTHLGEHAAMHGHGPIRNTFKRTHRWAKVLRNEDELAVTHHEDKVTHVLFSALPDDVGLYGKPMARNSQVWTHECRRLLDGPSASHGEIEQALHAVMQGGHFGYRFQYPAMRVGVHEIYWQRPLVAYLSPQSGHGEVVHDAPLGYLTAYAADRPDLAHPLELWPKLLRRELFHEALNLFHADDSHHHIGRQISLSVRKILDTRQLLGDKPLLRSFARRLLTTSKQETLDQWLESLPNHAPSEDRGRKLAEAVQRGLELEAAPLPEPMTYQDTSKRSFEVKYWKTIVYLAEGKFLTKNNADCVLDPVTQRCLAHRRRDLEALGDYLLGYYRKVVKQAGMAEKVLVGDLPFRWETEFNYAWSGGWLRNHKGEAEERDLIVVIPGRDRSRAVIMADHYDTAYMADHYDRHQGGNGARLAAAGADDNHSATAALMLGAPIFLELSRDGKLDCDIWLIHLTGEEFPADCLGARHLTQALVEGNLRARLQDGSRHDLSGTRIQGLYVLDMIAHNNDHDKDTFQISPGMGSEAMWLALQAHLAAEIWNENAEQWNRRASRRKLGRGRRTPHGNAVPEIARHLLLNGEVRPHYDPRSTLYNTDGQIFSDAGVPAVLFMENYDINRSGYHDRFDTMANIDLDYGAAFAAITIESVARAASGRPLV
jgi:hypothetical protein